MHRPDILRLEEIMQNAWPSSRVLQIDGWQIRLSDGLTRRSNSVQTLFSGRGDLIQKIELSERLYRSQNLKPIFKISPITNPIDLDQVLSDRGYQKEAPTIVMEGPIPSGLDQNPSATQEQQTSSTPIIQLNTNASPAWLHTLCDARNWSYTRATGIQDIMRNIPTRFICASLFEQAEDNQPVCIALGVLQQEYLHFLHLHTHVASRRRGLASLLSKAVFTWAQEAGCRRMLLSVEKDNNTAMAMYTRLGLKECYEYWYRSQKIG